MKIWKTISLGLLTSLLLGFGIGSTIAHEDGDKGKPQHGGQYLMDESHHGIEMVVTDKALTFHITEHLEPADLTGGSFKVIVQTDAGTKIHPLAIDSDKLTLALTEPLPKGAKIVLSGKDDSGHAIQARFVTQ